MTDDAPLGQVGAAGSGARDGRDRPREAIAERLGVPLLAALAADKSALPNVRSASLLALSKIANHAGVRTLLKDALHDRHGEDMVRDQDGRVFTAALWSRLARPEGSIEMPVALLTALGMQSAADVPDEVRDGLRALAVGRPVLERRWGPIERSHALTALCRLWPGGSFHDVLREVSRARSCAPSCSR